MTAVMLRYRLEMQDGDLWIPIIQDDSLLYLRGHLDARRDWGGPRLAYRLIRERDGREVDRLPAIDEVSIGMVAGWPTAEQYEAAAARALARAAAIRARGDESLSGHDPGDEHVDTSPTA